MLIVDLKAVNYWVHNLKINEMKCSLDLNIITQYLPLLTNLELGYGIKHSGFFKNLITNKVILMGKKVSNSKRICLE